MEQARISTSQGTQSPQQTARTRAHTQQKGITDDGAGAAAQPDSFLALLAAQDPEFAEGGDPLAAVPGVSDASSTLAAVDPSTLVGWQALVAGDSAAQQLRGSAGQGGSAEGMSAVGLLGQTGVARGAMAHMLSDPAGGAPALAGQLLAGQGLPAADGLVSQTAALDGGLPDASQPATATLGFGRQFSRLHSAALQRGASDAGLGGAGSVGAASARAAGGDAKQVAASTGDLSTMPTAVAAGVRELGTGLHRVSGESGATGADAALLANLDPTAAVAAPGARNADAGAGSESSRHGGSGGLGEGGAEPSFAVDGASGTSGFEELAQTGAEELLAEQVTYWANQKTQSAEVTLNRDGQPLAVTVALSGNEAHVTFRSDQEHTREMLDQSMAQLSELLRSEGLVLSGMTVGTSAGQGAMAGDAEEQQRNRSGDGQQGQVLVSGPTDVSQRLAGSGTRNNSAVDVFV
jgi:flagellar hook-length control protein FliK